MKYPISGGFYEAHSPVVSHQTCINYYVSVTQTATPFDRVLVGHAGIKQLATAGTGNANINRGSLVFDGKPYFVNGPTLYRLNRTAPDVYNLESLGAILGSGMVSMAQNGRQLMIVVPGSTGYIFDGALAAITDTDFTASGLPQTVSFIDAYFVVTTDEKKFVVSNLNDGDTWNALDFGSAETDPDAIVAGIKLKNQLMVFGTQTMEPFNNIGGAAFPFQRISGAVIDKGLSSPFAVVASNDVMMWLGAGKDELPAIWRSSGRQPEKISTTAIELAIQSHTDAEIAVAFAWAYAQSGAFFTGFTIGDDVFIHDSVSGEWCERKSYQNGSLTRWRVNSVVKAYGTIIVADNQDGRIGELDFDTYSEYGDDIFRQFSVAPIDTEGRAMFISELELTMGAGVGNSTVTNPMVSMDYTDDGHTWSNPREMPIGKKGEYERRAIWRRLGKVKRYRTFRFTITDQVKCNVNALNIEAQP